MAVLLGLVLVNCMPDVAHVLETVPVYENVSSTPEEEYVQEQTSATEEIQETFLWYVTRKYEGYVALDTGYNVLRNDNEMLSVGSIGMPLCD